MKKSPLNRWQARQRAVTAHITPRALFLLHAISRGEVREKDDDRHKKAFSQPIQSDRIRCDGMALHTLGFRIQGMDVATVELRQPASTSP